MGAKCCGRCEMTAAAGASSTPDGLHHGAIMTLDEFLARSQTCSCIDDLGTLFTGAVAALGYTNISFVRLGLIGEAAEQLFPKPLAMEAAAGRETSETGHCDAICHDVTPPGQRSGGSSRPAPKAKVGGPRSAVMTGDGRGHNLSIPLYNSNGSVDLVRVTAVGQASDEAVAARVTALAMLMRNRYWQLRQASPQPRRVLQRSHSGGPPDMTNAHCRALVLIDLAENRRKMGLPHLSDKLADSINASDLRDLQTWGYVVEEADDMVFRYYHVPSPLGTQHLFSCRQAREYRREGWRLAGLRHERCMKIDD